MVFTVITNIQRFETLSLTTVRFSKVSNQIKERRSYHD